MRPMTTCRANGMTRARRALFLLLLLAPAAPARGAIFDPHTVASEVLLNGLRIIVQEDAAASTATVEVMVRVGVADEPAGQEGVAHLLEHVLWASGGNPDPRAAIERVGGTTNAGTARDFTRFYATVPADEWRTALRAITQMVFRKSLDEAAIAREKRVVSEEAGERADRPQAALLDLAFQSVYGPSHPYGHRLEGSSGAYASVTAAQLGSFHRAWYAPNNIAVIVGGNVQAADVIEVVKTLVAGMEPRPVPDRHWPAVARPLPGKEVKAETSGREAYVMAAFVGPAISEPAQVAASDVLLTLLSDSTFGRLHKSLQGTDLLASGTGVEFLTQRDRALFGVWAACDPAKIGAVKEIIRQELTRLAQEKVSPQDLATAKRLTTAGYVFGNETPADRVTTLGFYEALTGYREAGQYLTRVEWLTADGLQQVAAWYAQEPVWIILTPKEQPQ